MLVLVTGGTGFIGSHLVEALLARGDRVRCLVRSRSALRWLEGLPVELVEGSIEDPASCRAGVEGVDLVHHVAGLIAADEAGFMRANAEGTRNVLAACLQESPNVRRVVVVTSQAAAGPSLDGVAVTEARPPRPISAYGRSKAEAERIASAFMDRLPVTIIRPPVVYGARDTAVLPYIKMIDWRVQPFVGRGKSLSIVYVKDLVEGLLVAAEHPRAVGRTYFLCNDRPCTWEELGDAAKKALGHGAVSLRVPEGLVRAAASIVEDVSKFLGKQSLFNRDKAGEVCQPSWVCDPGLAARELGFRCRTSIETGFQETVAWYRKAGWLS